MVTTFRNFTKEFIAEELHPELSAVVKSDIRNKQAKIAQTIRSLVEKGENTGVEGKMPKGSSRAYIPHITPENVNIDGKDAQMKIGTKVAIRTDIERHHEAANKGMPSLGAMQNEAENGDYFANDNYRILTHRGGNRFVSNENGIFPPLLAHDQDKHLWSTVGHVRNITDKDWSKLTRTNDFPMGITHKQFHSTLDRFHNRNNGAYHSTSAENERNLDKVEKHPLVQKFMDFHGTFGHPTFDYQQMKNLGVWKHPVTGEEHIVARDHGFSTEVMHAYSRAHMVRAGRELQHQGVKAKPMSMIEFGV